MLAGFWSGLAYRKVEYKADVRHRCYGCAITE